MVKLNDAGHRSLNSGIAMTVLATFAIILRFITRLNSKGSLGLDDLFAVAALLGMYAWFGVMTWGLIAGGGGANIASIAHEYSVFQAFLKSLYTLNAVYALAITCVKLSILFLYRRIFTTLRFAQVSLGFIVIVCVWWIIFTCCTLLPCIPPRKFWYPELDGPCYNYDEFFLGSEVVDIILDFAILTLPVRMVSTLQMSDRHKWVLYFVFLVGGGVCVTGVLRLAFTYVPHSHNISFTGAELWTNIHLGVAIICACLPTYRLLFRSIFATSSAVWSRFSSLFTSHRTLKAADESDHEGTYQMKPFQRDQRIYDQLSDPLGDTSNHYLTNAAAVYPSTPSQRSDREDLADPNSIVVRNVVSVV